MHKNIKTVQFSIGLSLLYHFYILFVLFYLNKKTCKNMKKNYYTYLSENQ